MTLPSALLALAVLVALAFPSSSLAELDIVAFDAQMTPNVRTADPTAAGGHPDLSLSLNFEQSSPDFAEGMLNDLRIELPPGLVANPQNVGICTRPEFLAEACPASSRVGTGFADPAGEAMGTGLELRLFNVRPHPGEPARIAISAGDNGEGFDFDPLGQTSVAVGPSTGYGVETSTIVFGSLIHELDLTFWGVPADNNASGAPAKPFITTPVDCSEAAAVRVAVDSVEHPGQYDTAEDALVQPTGCDQVPFAPSISVGVEAPWAGSTSPVTVDVGVEQNDDPNGRSAATVDEASVLLPPGMTINPGGANDLAACSDADFAKDSDTPAACPAASKVGTGSIDTPLLADPLAADIYVAEPQPGQMFRLFVYAEGQGVKVKLEGKIHPDPDTGQLRTSFEDNPPLPFSNLHLRFRGGGQSVLAMPSTCGEKTTVGSFVPHSADAPVDVSGSFTVDGYGPGLACLDPQPFGPSFTAGSTGLDGGGDTDFSMTFGRRDSDQFFGGVRVDLPEGLLGRLVGIPLCPNAKADADQCGNESLVGSTSVSAGAADSILTLPGRVYLTEAPEAGQVAGLAIVVPAKAGPYDLGTVVVHAGIEVDPSDASVSVVADSLPTIVEGVPLRLRQATVDVDRPGFMLNPTTCARKAIEGQLASVGGTVAKVATAFQARNCGQLGFEPKLGMRLTGNRHQMKADAHPGLKAVLTQPGGQTNIAHARVRLPRSLALDPNNAGAVCDFDAANQAKPKCPTASKVGRAVAKSPAVDGKLSGPVYLVQGIRVSETGNRIRTLPTLLVQLQSDTYPGLRVDLRARTGADDDGNLITKFGSIPDVPVRRFELRIAGGENGILAATRDVCPVEARVGRIELRGQNGRRTGWGPVIRLPRVCGG